MDASLKDILTIAHKAGASDVHLTCGSPPVFRIHGGLKRYGTKPLAPVDTERFAKEIFPERMWQVFKKNNETDFTYLLPEVSRFRINAYYQRSCVALAIRVIPNKVPTIDQLALPSVLKEIAKSPQGLILVTGPSGSGKTSTLAAIIQYINQNMSKHIITLEDPVEYLHVHNKSIIEQREIGLDTQSFANGLRSALRQDPDVVLVGEMRDLETIQTAITAAETGHLVLATLHTYSTPAAIHRIIDVFPPSQQSQIRYQLSMVLVAIIAQRLFPAMDGNGQRVATEILINNAAIANLIRTEKVHQIVNVLQISRQQGMHTLEASIKELVKNNSISKEDADTFLREKKNHGEIQILR